MFRRQFSLRLGFAQGSALAGFVAVFLADSVLPYVVGAPWAVVGFVRAAPTRRHLERLQDDLARQGCRHPLLAALQAEPVTAAGG